MIPRSLRLEESERKYQLVLENRKRLLSIANKRRHGLLELVQDCLSGKQKTFGGRFAKPARRNKIILEKISKIEATIDNNSKFPSRDRLQEKSIQTLLQLQNKNYAPDSISKTTTDGNNQVLHKPDQNVNQDETDEVVYRNQQNDFGHKLFREAYKSPLRPSLLKRQFLSTKRSQPISALHSKTLDENCLGKLKRHDAEGDRFKVKENLPASRVKDEPLVDLINAGVEINNLYFRGSVQAYIGNFDSQYPVMACIRLENIDDITLFDSSGFWVEIPNAAKKVHNKKVLGQNILRSIDISVDDSAIKLNTERLALLCEFM